LQIYNLYPNYRGFSKNFFSPTFHQLKNSKGCRFSPAALAFSMLIHSKRSHRSIAKYECMQLNTEHIIYSFSVSATIAWLSIYRRCCGTGPKFKEAKLYNIKAYNGG